MLTLKGHSVGINGILWSSRQDQQNTTHLTSHYSSFLKHIGPPLESDLGIWATVQTRQTHAGPSSHESTRLWSQHHMMYWGLKGPFFISLHFKRRSCEMVHSLSKSHNPHKMTCLDVQCDQFSTILIIKIKSRHVFLIHVCSVLHLIYTRCLAGRSHWYSCSALETCDHCACNLNVVQAKELRLPKSTH